MKINYSTTEFFQWSYIDWNSLNFHWISDSHWFKFDVFIVLCESRLVTACVTLDWPRLGFGQWLVPCASLRLESFVSLFFSSASQLMPRSRLATALESELRIPLTPVKLNFNLQDRLVFVPCVSLCCCFAIIFFGSATTRGTNCLETQFFRDWSVRI